ncbi:MAG: hypothetical protein ACTTH7_06075, partial [Treponema sp.]
AATSAYNEFTFKLKVKKAAVASPVNRVLSTTTQSDIHGVKVQLSATYADEIELPSSVDNLAAGSIKFAFDGESSLVAASEVHDEAGTGAAPALKTSAQTYTVKFAATSAYNEFTFKLKVKKAS